MKHTFIFFLILILICGCNAAKTTKEVASEVVSTPTSLLNPNLYQSFGSEAYQQAEKAPPEEWKVIKTGRWKQDNYDKKKNRECRRVEKRHIPTGVIEVGWECRPIKDR